MVGCSGRLRGWGSCGSGCVVRLFLDNSTACFSVSVSVLACCGSAWFFFEWIFLSCPVFSGWGRGCSLVFVVGSGSFAGLVRWFFTESLILAQDERWRRA